MPRSSLSRRPAEPSQAARLAQAAEPSQAARMARLARRTTVVGVAAVLAGSLVACGAGQPESASGATATRTVTDVTGTAVQVPATPSRVVALSEQDLDGLVTLGITPVGTINGRGQTTPPQYLGDKVAGITVVGDVAKPSMDKLVAVEPDLILAGSVTDQQVLADLRKLAPTVVTYQPQDDWKSALRKLAEAVGRGEAATRWLTDYNSTVIETKSRIGGNGGVTVSIVRWNPQGPGIMQTGHFASLVAKDLGFSRPAGQQEPGFAHTAPLSLENLSRVDANWLFIGTLNADGRKALDVAQDSPAYRQLGAVRANRVVTVDGTVWTSRGGPAAALLVIADIEKAMTR